MLPDDDANVADNYDDDNVLPKCLGTDETMMVVMVVRISIAKVLSSTST